LSILEKRKEIFVKSITEKVKVLRDHLLVCDIGDFEEPVKKTEKSIIILPPSMQSKVSRWRYGEVLSTGKGKTSFKNGKRIPVDVKVGERVLYKRYMGTIVKEIKENKFIRILALDQIQATVV
jgi:chaperonin GroES